MVPSQNAIVANEGFIGIPDPKNTNPGARCYWEGATPEVWIYGLAKVVLVVPLYCKPFPSRIHLST